MHMAMQAVEDGLGFLTENDATDINAATTHNVSTPVSVQIGNILSIISGLIGALVAAYVMWFFGFDAVQGGVVMQDVVILEEAALGFILLAVIVFIASGSASYYFAQLTAFTPNVGNMWEYGGITTFDVYVKVHQVKNTVGPGGCDGFYRTQGDLYMEVDAGRYVANQFCKCKNGHKATCISTKGVFEETFHFVITPSDDKFHLVLKDQNVVGEETLGEVDIDIGEEVVKGWPQRKAYRLHKKAHWSQDDDEPTVAGTVVVSFFPGDKDKKMAEKLKRRDELAGKKLEDAMKSRRQGFKQFETTYHTRYGAA